MSFIINSSDSICKNYSRHVHVNTSTQCILTNLVVVWLALKFLSLRRTESDGQRNESS